MLVLSIKLIPTKQEILIGDVKEMHQYHLIKNPIYHIHPLLVVIPPPGGKARNKRKKRIDQFAIFYNAFVQNC